MDIIMNEIKGYSKVEVNQLKPGDVFVLRTSDECKFRVISNEEHGTNYNGLPLFLVHYEPLDEKYAKTYTAYKYGTRALWLGDLHVKLANREEVKQ